MILFCEGLSLTLLTAIVLLALVRALRGDTGAARLFRYIPPALACLLAAFVGEHGRAILSLLLVAVALPYVIYVLRPFGLKPGDAQ